MRRILCLMLTLSFFLHFPFAALAEESAPLRWVDFTVTAEALRDTAEEDIRTHGGEGHISWIVMLAYLGQKYGGDFSDYRREHLVEFLTKARASSPEEAVGNQKLYRYYLAAYGAVLGGMLGAYRLERETGGERTITEEYGIKAFHPIAAGYYFAHSDDFGNKRSFGYKRKHLGHDMMGSLGTPIIAMESGYVEAIGWNIYGGWRIGIRSFDGLRYYYYAHLRRGHPYASLSLGDTVCAGEVIGYMGRTGYSTKEDTDNIKTVHLHLGMELIFSPEQKDGYVQIWIDLYELCKFLAPYRSTALKKEDGEMHGSHRIYDGEMPD